MSTYEVHAYDIVTGTRVLANVPFTSFRWTSTLNDQPLLDSRKRPEFYGILAVDDTASLPSLTPGRTLLVVEDTSLSVPIYAGIVWAWPFNRSQHGFDVTGESVWSYWRRRFIVGTTGMTDYTADVPAEVVAFDAVEQFDIVADLIAHGVATGASADLQFADVRQHLPAGAPSGVVQSTGWTVAQHRSIADAVEEVARLDDGFDFMLTYEWDAGSPPALLLYLDLCYPRCGSVYATALTDADNVTVTMLDRPAYDMANPLTVVETVDGSLAHTVTIDDVNRADLGGTFPWLDGTYVTREHGRDEAALTALGEARMAYTRGPVYNGQVEIGPTVALGDIEPGDTVDLVAIVNGLDVTATERVQAKRVLITAGELDTWSLGLVDDTASVGLFRGRTAEAAADSFPSTRTWVPTIKQGAATDIAKTVGRAAYWLVGPLVFFEFFLAITGTGDAGSGVLVSLPPILPDDAAGNYQAYAGTGVFKDASAGFGYKVQFTPEETDGPSAGFFVMHRLDTTGVTSIGNDPAVALASGDYIRGQGWYMRQELL